MPACFLVGATRQFHCKVRLKHTLSVCIAWLDAVKGRMPFAYINSLRHGNEGVATQKADRLKLFFVTGRGQPITKFSNRSIDALPAGRLHLFSAPRPNAIDERVDEPHLRIPDAIDSSEDHLCSNGRTNPRDCRK